MICEKRFRHTVTFLCLLVTISLLGALFLPVHGEEKIYDTVIRLHVLANSDSEEDQVLKLLVRDAILSDSGELLLGAADRAEAISRIEERIPHLTEVAEQTLRASGCDAPVSITFTKENYPTRRYESFCFPSGDYLSLRVLIGEAAGQNWWCVLFPPLCLGAASATKAEAEDAMIAVGLSKDQYGIITETQNTKYKLRFKLLETIEKIFR